MPIIKRLIKLREHAIDLIILELELEYEEKRDMRSSLMSYGYNTHVYRY